MGTVAVEATAAEVIVTTRGIALLVASGGHERIAEAIAQTVADRA